MARYTPDHAGTKRYLQFSPGLKREMYRRGRLGLSVAAALAPRRTGSLAASGKVIDDGPHGGFQGDRMQFSIVFDIGYAVPATFPDENDPGNLAYLRAAIAVIER